MMSIDLKIFSPKGDIWSGVMNPEYEKLFGGNIRRAREARGMTQEQVAAKLQLGGCDITPVSYTHLTLPTT